MRLQANVAKRARVRENALYLVFKIEDAPAAREALDSGGATVMKLVLAGERLLDGQLVRPKEVQAA